jgi:adenosylcobinamide kinase/adenosylcobinamide-phosphate guanylyltransferase
MGAIVLVTGGARSGKSLFAEMLAAGLGACVTYVATAEVSDAEMDARVARHRERRPASWITREAPHDLRIGLAGLDQQVDVVLVDCLTVWVSNRLLTLGDPEQGGWWAAVEAIDRTLADEVGAVLALARGAPWHLVLVTNEVGYGVVPPTPLGRTFRDLLGGLNQWVAAQADAVFLVVAGLGVEVKRLAVAPQAWARSVTAADEHPD